MREPTTLTSIYAARALRDFGDGYVAVLLPVYLLALGLGAFEVGVVATLALLGSAAMTLVIGQIGARIDQRTLLILAAGLMTITGIAFAASSTYAVILLVATVGTINPSAGSVSIFVPLEHAVLSRSVADAERTRMLARYSLIGGLAAALGAVASGSPQVLTTLGIDRVTALKGMFLLYAALGLAGGALYRLLPVVEPRHRGEGALGPSYRVVLRLAALFSLDAFAGGFAVQSLLALWLFSKFGLSLSAAGLFDIALLWTFRHIRPPEEL
jgi:MFS family permease